MKFFHINLLLIFVLGASFAAKASDVKFSAGTGYPFIGILEVSVPAMNNDQRVFANVKAGLDYGFSVGFEQQLPGNNQTMGFTLGAIGSRDATNCSDTTENSTGEFICSLFEPLDSEATNGLGINYSYYFSGVHNAGFKIRFEGGYGQSSRANVNRFDGGVILSYQF
jgi:hypothetical protein